MRVEVQTVLAEPVISATSHEVAFAYGHRKNRLSVGRSTDDRLKGPIAPLRSECHKKIMELLGVEPRASCMLSTRSTN